MLAFCKYRQVILTLVWNPLHNIRTDRAVTGCRKSLSRHSAAGRWVRRDSERRSYVTGPTFPFQGCLYPKDSHLSPVLQLLSGLPSSTRFECLQMMIREKFHNSSPIYLRRWQRLALLLGPRLEIHARSAVLLGCGLACRRFTRRHLQAKNLVQFRITPEFWWDGQADKTLFTCLFKFI